MAFKFGDQVLLARVMRGGKAGKVWAVEPKLHKSYVVWANGRGYWYDDRDLRAYSAGSVAQVMKDGE